VAKIIIPLKSKAYYNFFIALEDLNWKITMRWNDTTAAWAMDLEGISESSIKVEGIRLVGGVDLLKPYAIKELGQMFIFDTEEKNEDPNFDDIGNRFILYYFDTTEESVTG